MFLIPTGTDRDTGKRPILVPLLVAICTVVYFAQRSGGPIGALLDSRSLGVAYYGFQWWQTITYQFLHGGFMHLLFNMFFLAAFGILLEGRIGRIAFLAVFLSGGIIAAVVQVWVGAWIDPASKATTAIGASGSVSALMGVAFALHPNAHVRGIAIPQFVRAQTSLRWLLGFAIALDVVRTIIDWSGQGNSGIATLAHLGGLVFGLLLGLAILAVGWVRRDDVDLLLMITQWRRRRAMRLAMKDLGTGGPAGTVAPQLRADAAFAETAGQRALRGTIAAAHRERDYHLAANLYLELLQTLPDATLPAPIQLDVANQLAHESRHRDAARAYARFLERFRTHAAADDVRLMLAAIEVRHLQDHAAGARTLAGFAGRELDAGRRALMDTLLDECRGAEA